LLFKSAGGGYAEAQYQAHFLCTYDQIKPWLLLAANQGHIEAMYKLACLHYSDFEAIKPIYSSEEDGRDAFKWFNEYIEKTKPEDRYAFAHDAIGAMHYRIPEFQNYEKAFYHLTMAITLIEAKRPYKRIWAKDRFDSETEAIETVAELLVAGIYYHVGLMYFNGWGTKQDYQKASDNFLTADNLYIYGHDEALYHLYLIYRDGLGREKDAIKASEYLLKSATKGYAEANYQMAVNAINHPSVQAYWYGESEDEDDDDDEETAKSLIDKAIPLLNNKKHIDSLIMLGVIYWFRNDYCKCLEIWTDAKALDKERADVNYYLYRLYSEHCRNEVLDEEGVECARIFEKNKIIGQKLLLTPFKDTSNLLKNYDIQAYPNKYIFNCCQKLIEYGNCKAQYVLSWLYWFGTDIEENKGEAIKYFCQALQNDKNNELAELRDKLANFETSLIIEAGRVKQEELVSDLKKELVETDKRVIEIQEKIKELVASIGGMKGI
jgi:TPR repeat protein